MAYVWHMCGLRVVSVSGWRTRVRTPPLCASLTTRSRGVCHPRVCLCSSSRRCIGGGVREWGGVEWSGVVWQRAGGPGSRWVVGAGDGMGMGREGMGIWEIGRLVGGGGGGGGYGIVRMDGWIEAGAHVSVVCGWLSALDWGEERIVGCHRQYSTYRIVNTVQYGGILCVCNYLPVSFVRSFVLHTQPRAR